MRVCFVGKYPPIQGGVSAHSYWAVRGLAERGHEVYVVSNAAEVEQNYRLVLTESDIERMESSFSNGGRVRVFYPEQGTERMGHIPLSNPFVTKLAGMATQVVREFNCDLIVGSYFEPYGVAAWMTARWTSIPLVLQHAGSDIDRLMRLPEMGTVYKEILRDADGVITRRQHFNRFQGLGVRPDVLRAGPPHVVPRVFSPDAQPLSVDDIEHLVRLSSGSAAPTAFDPDLPTIGMYGKPGFFKGTFDLLAALRALKRDGAMFNLMLMCGESRRDELVNAVDNSGLGERTWLLPFVPHWRVPAFIRRCTAVCFLERDFPVVIHGPVVPREVLACGTCLVLSGEIHAKQRNSDELIDRDNILLVPDPKDHEVLVEQLRYVIERPMAAQEIGKRGRRLAEDFPDFDDFIDSWESILYDSALPSGARRHEPEELGERIAATTYWAQTLLGDEFDDLVSRFSSEHGGADSIGSLPDPTLAHRFCRFLAGKVSPALSDVARYHEARLWSMWDDGQPVAPIQSSLAGTAAHREQIRNRYPRRSVPMRIESFTHDVRPLFALTDQQPIKDERQLRACSHLVCFARLANLAPTELSLNEATATLLDLCEGDRTTHEIVVALAGELADSGAQPGLVGDQVLGALGRLHALGLLSFADRPTAAVPLMGGHLQARSAG